MRVEKADEIGFCFGVKRAIDILERVAHERERVETLGAVVHNQQVLQRLDEIGVRVAKNENDIQGNIVVDKCRSCTDNIVEGNGLINDTQLINGVSHVSGIEEFDEKG